MKYVICLMGLFVSFTSSADVVEYDVTGFFSDPYYAADHRSLGEDTTKELAEQSMIGNAKRLCSEASGKFIEITESLPEQHINASRYIFSYKGRAKCDVQARNK